MTKSGTKPLSIMSGLCHNDDRVFIEFFVRLCQCSSDSLVQSSTADRSSHPLYKEAAALLVELAKALPLELCDDCHNSLRSFLAVSEEYSFSEHEVALAQSIRSLSQMLATLHQMQLLPYRDDMDDPFDAFLLDVSNVSVHETGFENGNDGCFWFWF